MFKLDAATNYFIQTYSQLFNYKSLVETYYYFIQTHLNYSKDIDITQLQVSHITNELSVHFITRLRQP